MMGANAMEQWIKMRYFIETWFTKLIYRGDERQARLARLAEAQQRQEQELQQLRAQQALQREQREAQERAEIEALLASFVDVPTMNYTQYEWNELRRNKRFFEAVSSRVFEPGERGLTFLYCEFDKSSRKEFRGYLIVTNKRVYFLRTDLQFVEKFRYQTIHDVRWFADGFVERGLRIQYGTRKLEFDEIYDNEQMLRVGNLILKLSSR
jgi:hypothetical protein